MLIVEFRPNRLVEYTDPRLYQQRVGRWMELREAENCHLLAALPELMANAANPSAPKTRMLAIEDRDQVLAAALAFANGCLVLTWGSPETSSVLAQGLFERRCRLTSMYGPAHVCWQFAELWTKQTGEQFEHDRSERLYQLARTTYIPPRSGRLEPATPADCNLVRQWLGDFTREAEHEDHNLALAADQLIANGQVFLWKNAQAVSMAAWVSPTPSGGSINLVYTPPAHRRKGHATAVVAALGGLKLAQGRRFCFILADPTNHGTHGLYHKVGARTLCEFLRCKIVAQPALVRPVAPLSVSTSWI